MENKLEKRLQQKDINATPKTILEDLFSTTDEKRIGYEEQITKYKNKINSYNSRIDELKKELEDPCDDTTVKELKDMKSWIKDYEQLILEAKKEIRLLIINCNILWKNELKMDKVLGYGLEE